MYIRNRSFLQVETIGDGMWEITVENKIYQWDLNRQVKITLPEGTEADEAHFAHPNDKKALVVRIKEIDGIYVADIPNILLQSDKRILVWIVNDNQTLHSKSLAVIPRIKPDDYAYEETEILRIADIEKRIAELAAVVAYIEVEGTVNLVEVEFLDDGKGNVTLILPGAIISDDCKGNVTITLPDISVSDDGAGNIQIVA